VFGPVAALLLAERTSLNLLQRLCGIATTTARAVAALDGTATRVRVPGVTVAGKTGTAEFARDDNKDGQPDRDEKGNLPTHAWFTSFAPYNDPEIVVTVFVANGGEGSAVAAPVATKILQAYFAKNPPAGAQK